MYLKLILKCVTQSRNNVINWNCDHISPAFYSRFILKKNVKFLLRKGLLKKIYIYLDLFVFKVLLNLSCGTLQIICK